jgi:hypothetical protein
LGGCRWRLGGEGKGGEREVGARARTDQQQQHTTRAHTHARVHENETASRHGQQETGSHVAPQSPFTRPPHPTRPPCALCSRTPSRHAHTTRGVCTGGPGGLHWRRGSCCGFEQSPARPARHARPGTPCSPYFLARAAWHAPRPLTITVTSIFPSTFAVAARARCAPADLVDFIAAHRFEAGRRRRAYAARRDALQQAMAQVERWRGREGHPRQASGDGWHRTHAVPFAFATFAKREHPTAWCSTSSGTPTRPHTISCAVRVREE